MFISLSRISPFLSKVQYLWKKSHLIKGCDLSHFVFVRIVKGVSWLDLLQWKISWNTRKYLRKCLSDTFCLIPFYTSETVMKTDTMTIAWLLLGKFHCFMLFSSYYSWKNSLKYVEFLFESWDFSKPERFLHQMFQILHFLLYLFVNTNNILYLYDKYNLINESQLKKIIKTNSKHKQ